MLEIHGLLVDSYLHDCATVWLKIIAMFQEKPAWKYSKAGNKSRNDRKVYMENFYCYLGPNKLQSHGIYC